MALSPARRFSSLPWLLACSLLLAVSLPPAVARGEDSRKELARKIRDDILARRALPARAQHAQEEDPFAAAVESARARLAEVDARLEGTRRRSESLATPREKLSQRNDELAAQTAKLDADNRARVEAVYRSAKLGGRAAGWNEDAADSARLTRYLAAIAAAGQQSVTRLEVEHGNVIAALDRARADDAAAQAELHSLEADRAEAEASLARATDEAQTRPDAAVAAIAAREAESAGADTDAADGGDGVDEQNAAEEDAASGAAPRPDVAAAQALAHDKDASAREFERALAEATAKLHAKTSSAPLPPGGTRLAPADVAARSSAGGADFQWPASEEPVGNKSTSKEKEVAAAQADQAALANVANAATAAKDAKAASEASAAKDAQAAKDALAAKDAATKAAAAEAAKAPPAGEVASKEADAANDEPDDEPSGLAPAVAEPAPAPGESAPDGAVAGKPRGFLSRIFGGDDRESDRFASARGGLPPPVSGKVVANYGQQHKSGATYRGVILRAGHNAPIKSVAEGRVSFVGDVPGLGKTVIVSHGSRYHTVYARLGEVEVKEGDKVSGGTEVGTLPDNDADMHFEVRDKGKAVDPLPWLRTGPH